MPILPFPSTGLEDLSLKLQGLIIKPEILENYDTSLELTQTDLSDKSMFKEEGCPSRICSRIRIKTTEIKGFCDSWQYQ